MVDILEIINETFDELLGDIPCYNTIENWMKKCGLQVYQTAGESLQGADYAQITDESMMIGCEKLLFILGISAEHQGDPLNHGNICLLNMAVAESWNGEGVGTQLLAAAQKVGHDPLYVISDNASIMNKGAKCAGLKHHHDISHSLGMYLERTYKEEQDFTTYLKLMTEPKFKYNMKKIAYLLPPKQRTIARFINLSAWVEWSRKMLSVYHTLDTDEQAVFSFIPANASLIEELFEVMECVKSIEHICKHEGLSKQTVSQCLKKIRKSLLQGNKRMIKLGSDIIGFLIKEATLLESDKAVHHNSTDIVESLFGTFKARKSPNKLYGVTPFVLFVPLHAKLAEVQQAKTFNFKSALEEVRLCNIDSWAKENLSPNLVNKRTECLQKAG